MTTLPPLVVYPATRDLVVLRNSTFRKRFQVRAGGDPIDLTTSGTIIDSEIKSATGARIGVFTASLTEDDGMPIPGFFDLALTPEESLVLPMATNHTWSLSITYPSGDRFYYCKGLLDVREVASGEQLVVADPQVELTITELNGVEVGVLDAPSA